jgi:hypothetical protein
MPWAGIEASLASLIARKDRGGDEACARVQLTHRDVFKSLAAQQRS